MNPDIVDLRSDTVTKPSAAMRQAMAAADVGDDVLGDDPTIIALQERFAAMMGKAAGLYVPSGTMGNQVCIRALTEPGDEIVADADSHFYYYEGGAPAALSGCSVRFVPSHRGQFDVDALRSVLRPNNAHFPPTTLIIIENTHNRGGGTIWPIERIAELRAFADERGLKMHLDGARLMNACIKTGKSPADYAQYFDTVTMCFSKGLGAPVGSAVAGSAEHVRRAHRFRKMFGGAMRQSGVLAAAAMYALDHNVERLADDHANARFLAEAIADIDGFSVDIDAVETNLVFFNVDPRMGTAPDLVARLKQRGVWMLPESERRARAVTHLDVSRAQIERGVGILREIAAAPAVAS